MVVFYLGICSGLGLWIQYLGLTTLATIFLIWFFRDKLFFWQKEFLIFLSGFLIGFSPFMIYNLSYDFASFNSDVVIHSGVFIQPLSESIVKLKNLLFVYLPHSFQLGNLLIFKANLTSWLVYLIFLFSVFFLIKENLKKKEKKFSLELLLIIYLAISLLMISFTKTRVGGINLKWGVIDNYKFYYLFFFQPIFLILTGIALGKLIDSKKRLKKIGWSLLILLMLILIPNYFNLISFRNGNTSLFRSNYDISSNAYEAGFSHARNKAFFKIFQFISTDLKPPFLKGAGANWYYYLENKKLDRKLKRLLVKQINGLSGEEKRVFLRWVLQGEWQYLSYGKKDEKTILDIYYYLSPVLNDQDRLILGREFFNLAK